MQTYNSRINSCTICLVFSSYSHYISRWRINSENWKDSISHFSSLLDKDDRLIRVAFGETIALIFEIGQLEKFVGEAKGSSDSSIYEGSNSQNGCSHIQGLKGKILNQVRNLFVEADGKGSTKKDLNSQRNLFRDVVEFFELCHLHVALLTLPMKLTEQVSSLHFEGRNAGYYAVGVENEEA